MCRQFQCYSVATVENLSLVSLNTNEETIHAEEITGGSMSQESADVKVNEQSNADPSSSLTVKALLFASECPLTQQ